jgi:FkbH-like protein
VTTLTFSEIQDELRNPTILQLPELAISVLRNVMIEPIEPYLRYNACKMGYNAHVSFGEYDNIYQEAVGDSPKLFNEGTECILVFMYLENISWNLARDFASMRGEAVQLEIDRIKDQVAATITGIRRQSSAMVLWHSFELPVTPSLGIWDSQIETGQLGAIRELNAGLRKQLREATSMYYVDTNLCISRVGAKNFYDQRYWHIGRAPYSRQALREIAFEEFKYLRPLKGKNKKCLVLDCDNTLWGGIIGEDGLSGIKLGRTHPGSSYYEFQQEVLNLYHRGILIALCSKNNENDVWDVFRNHPDMLLKEQHISTAEINWHDKAMNIRKIARDLNIGLDSMVFIDDSEFEVNLIKKELPEVETILFAKDQAVHFRTILADFGAFDTLTISQEDWERGKMYKAEASRKKVMLQTSDMDGYYQSLDMIAEIRFADDFSVPRIAQLTQKTNQFNLTTRRYSEADIKKFVTEGASDVIYLKLKDRFGDLGIVGVCVLKYADCAAFIDSFLLSCRALGRGVEDLLLINALKISQKRGYCAVNAGYVPTLKNQQAELFYPKRGFIEFNGLIEGSGKNYRFDLGRTIPQAHTYFKEIISDIE